MVVTLIRKSASDTFCQNNPFSRKPRHNVSISFQGRKLEKAGGGAEFSGCIGVKFRKHGNGRVRSISCPAPALHASTERLPERRVLLISMGSKLSSSHPRGMYRGEFFWYTFQWGRKCENVAAQETGRGTPVWDPVTFMGGSC